MKQFITISTVLLALVVTGLRDVAADPSPKNLTPRQHLDRVMQDPLFSRWQLRQQRAERGSKGADWLGLEEWGKTLGRWLDDLGKWLGDILERVFGRGPSAMPMGWSSFEMGGFLKIMGWVVLIVTAWVILWMLYGVLRQRLEVRAAVVGTRSSLAKALQEGQALAADSQTWIDHADQLADHADLRLAYRAMYLALLSGLHSSGRIQFRRNRTNWNYVSAFQGLDEERVVFSSLTQRFDDTWYGLQSPDAAAFERVGAEVRRLIGGAGA